MGVSGNSVAGKSFQIFTVSEELLQKVTEAVQAGDKEARSSKNIQSFEVFCHGFRMNISLGRLMIIPPAVCNDRENFPTALLHGALVRVFGTGGEEISDLIEKKIGESEFDEYSQADFDTLKKELFVDPNTGEEACLIVFAPNWMNSREYICFHFTKDAEKLKNNLRHQVFAAYYNPAVSSAFDALMTNVDTTKVDVTDITPKLTYPFLSENPLKEFPRLDKQAGYKKATILLNKKTADDVTKETLEPQELDVFDALDTALENSLGVDSGNGAAGEGGFTAPEDKPGVPREASKQAAPHNDADTGAYVKVENDPQGNLLVSATDLGRKEIAAMMGEKNRGTDALLADAMEDLTSNGWEWVSPEDIGALTSAPILMAPSGNVYWHERYAIEDPIEMLANGEQVRFDFGGNKFEDEEKPESTVASSKKADVNPPASHETPFTNVGPGSAAADAQKGMVPAAKESIEDAVKQNKDKARGPIGIAIDETGVPRRK